MKRRIPVLLISMLLGCLPVQAAEAPHPWETLPEDSQRVLKPFADQWDRIPAERQSRLLKGVERWKGLDPAQRKIISQRFQRWRGMSLEQKLKVREHFRHYRNLPREDRELLKNKYRSFQQMPKSRKRVLRERWEKLTPIQREHVLDKRMNRMKELDEDAMMRKQPMSPQNMGRERSGFSDTQPQQAPHTDMQQR